MAMTFPELRQQYSGWVVGGIPPTDMVQGISAVLYACYEAGGRKRYMPPELLREGPNLVLFSRFVKAVATYLDGNASRGPWGVYSVICSFFHGSDRLPLYVGAMEVVWRLRELQLQEAEAKVQKAALRPCSVCSKSADAMLFEAEGESVCSATCMRKWLAAHYPGRRRRRSKKSEEHRSG